MHILVTGAGGFIGSHVVEALVKAGHQVRALVRYNSRGSWGHLDEASPEFRSAVEVHLGDVTDPSMVRELVTDCDVVLHLAALIGIPYSYHAPASYVATNVSGTLNILEACRAAKTRRVVVTSTSEVYGSARQVPICEAHPLQGQSPYSATKIGADKLAESYWLSFKVPTTIVRPFNTYGPRMRPNDGRVVPAFIKQALLGEPLTLFGDGRQTRSFCYVSDLIRGIYALSQSQAHEPVNMV